MMDKEKIVEKYFRALLHAQIGQDAGRRRPVYRKSIRKQEYLARRGKRAEMQLTQFESIPFLAKARRSNRTD